MLWYLLIVLPETMTLPQLCRRTKGDVYRAPIASSNSHLVIAGATILLAAFSTLPYIAVWAMPHTSGDLLLLCLFGIGLMGTAIVAKGRNLLFPRSVLEYQRT